MAKISLFGRKRTSDLVQTHESVAETRRDELRALKLQGEQTNSHEAGSLQNIPLDMIVPDPNQPRKTMRNIDALAASIQEKGIIQPIIVAAKNADNRYQIIVGERRYQASKQAGLPAMPCIVRKEDAANTLILQLLENDQREGVSPLEESDALAQLVEDLAINKQEVAKELGRDAAWVSIRLGLQQASDAVKDLVKDGLVEDIRTLHELRMLEKEQPSKAWELIERVRKDEVSGSYRDVIAAMRKQKTSKRKPKPLKIRRVLDMQKKGNQLILDIGGAQPLVFKVEPAVMVQFLANISYDA